jgi:hypothetical protein
MHTAKVEPGKPDPKVKCSKAADPEGEKKVDVPVQNSSRGRTWQTYGVGAKNIRAQKKIRDKKKKHTSTSRSESKAEERGIANESSSGSTIKMSPSLDPREERTNPTARVESATKSQRGDT